MIQKVEDLEEKIRALENENRLLKELLTKAGASYNDIADDGRDGSSKNTTKPK